MLSSKDFSVIKEQAYSGFPSHLRGVCDIYPGMMKDMLKMGSLEYSNRLNLLLMTETDIEKIIKEKGGDISQLGNFSTLSYLLKSAELNEMFFLELEKALSTFI